MAECEKCKGTGMASEWHIPQPFNPGSAPQKLALIKHFGLKVPKKRGEDRDTTEAKFLKRFAKKHPVFGTIVECQQREKLISTYMWPGGPDGRVRTTYTFAPSTWRKASRAVNLQNIPKRSDLAQVFRRMLVAAPGHMLVEVDSSAIEAVLVGFCAGDQDYIRMAQLGIHDFVTAKLVGVPVPVEGGDEGLRRIFKEVKANYHEQREAAKRGVHGTNYLLTAHGLNDEYPEFFPTRRKGEEFQEFYFSLFPRLKLWHQSTLERAHKECFLDNHYGYRHYFYSVFQWDKKRQTWILGDDAKRAVAFVPQSDASAIQTEDILTLAETSEVEPHLRLIIHDSLVLEVPEAEVDKVAKMVMAVMTRPRPELGGLAIGAEAKAGMNLGDYDPVANPSGMRTLNFEGDKHEGSNEVPSNLADAVAGSLHHGSDPSGPQLGLADRP